MKKHYLVGYDISDPKRLAKVARTVSGFGMRVQYSFFHCHLSNRQKRQMKTLLKRIIHDSEDQVMILPVTERQIKDIEFVGFKLNLEAEGIFIV